MAEEKYWHDNVDLNLPWHRRHVLEGKSLSEKISSLLKSLEDGDDYLYFWKDRPPSRCHPYYIIEDGGNLMSINLTIAQGAGLTSDCPVEYRKDKFVVVKAIRTMRTRQGLGYKVMRELIRQSLKRQYHLLLLSPYNQMSIGLAEKLKMKKHNNYYAFHY